MILSALSVLVPMSAGLFSLSTFINRKRSLLDRFRAPECFHIEMLHLARSTRVVIMPRAAAESLCTRSGSWQPMTVRNLLQMPHAAARVGAYNSASPLEREMTPCVVELVSSTSSSLSGHDCPITISVRPETPVGFPVGVTMRDAASARSTSQHLVLDW